MPQNQKRRKAILRFIADFANRFGYPPSMREIAGAARVALNTIFYYVKALAKLGYVEHQAHRPRALRVTEAGKEYAAV